MLFFASGKREGFKSVIGAEGIDVYIAIFRNELLRVNPIEKFRYPGWFGKNKPEQAFRCRQLLMTAVMFI